MELVGDNNQKEGIYGEGLRIPGGFLFAFNLI
jgi:hypothetical protein